MRRLTVLALSMLLAACASQAITPAPAAVAADSYASGIELPASVAQGGLVLGRVPVGSEVELQEQSPSAVESLHAPLTALKVASNGRVVFGVGRDETGGKMAIVHLPDRREVRREIAITPRKFVIENINGVPEATVNPSPEDAARIEREQAQVNLARTRDDDRTDFDVKLAWPVLGRISGHYGSQRIYNGTPKSWHSGVDVAATQGTPVHAPAGGIVIFANPDLFLTGGTVLIDHGLGISSNFLHLSRIDVKVGERVEQGQVIGLVGKTGRATGPHMHWGMNWLTVRIDPELLVDPAANPQ
jgi:murein DD-endopeptidase MepM/ murein hydrolase activator NlpD